MFGLATKKQQPTSELDTENWADFHINKSRRKYDEYRAVLDALPMNVIVADPKDL